jgi:hypothetical protein
MRMMVSMEIAKSLSESASWSQYGPLGSLHKQQFTKHRMQEFDSRRRPDELAQ